MYIKISELCKLELTITHLQGALSRDPRSFVEGYGNIQRDIDEAQEAVKNIQSREANKLARKIAKTF